MKPESRLLDEYTWPEAYDRMQKSDAVYLPIGPQECHGRLMPMGTDFYNAAACCLLAAEKTNAVVMHPFAYSFPGATASFRGTVSIPFTLVIEVIKAIVRSLWKQKFRSIFVVYTHGPDQLTAIPAVRELFEFEKIVAASFNPYEFSNGKTYRFNHGYTKETAMNFAALEVLGKSDLIPKEEIAVDETYPVHKIPGLDGIHAGFYYQDVKDHQPACKVDREAGNRMLQDAAAELVRQTGCLREYVKFIETGRNDPWDPARDDLEVAVHAVDSLPLNKASSTSNLKFDKI